MARQQDETVPTLTLIGAGSLSFGLSMCADICQTSALRQARVRLVDIDPQRLDRSYSLYQRANQSAGFDLKLSKTLDRTEALPGSDYVITSVAEDRIERWDRDLAISRKYGIIESQGECGGPGGLSLTLRNIPLMLDIARDVAELAPGALLLNFTNPMQRVCWALCRYTDAPTVGLCHGLLCMKECLSNILGREVNVHGCGINHFNWISDITYGDTNEDAGADALQALRARDDIGCNYVADLMECFGHVVTPNDGHVTDFVHHWLDNTGHARDRYAIKPKQMQPYRDRQTQWNAELDDYIAGRQDPMAGRTKLSGEGAIPIIVATSGLAPAYDEIAVNIPNDGCIANLPEGALVEVPARVSTAGVKGHAMGNLPKGIRSLVARQLDIAELAVEAAVEGSYDKALQALAIDPLITDLSMARGYLDDVLQAHRDLLPQFK